jgi:integrase
MSDRRAPGTGSIIERRDSAGRITYFGKWSSSSGRQVKRKLGPKRSAGTSDGLTRRQAESELRRLMAEVKVAAPAREVLTVQEVGDRYRVHLERAGRKRSTLLAVDMCLRAHLVPFFGDKSINAITRNDIADLINVLEVEKELSPKSVHNYVGTLSALFSFAMGPRRRWATQNPCVGAELPKIPEHVEIRWLDLEEVDSLINHAQAGDYQQIDRALYRTAAMTGLRQGELIALRWRDVDWIAARIRVRQNYVRGEFGTPKSRRSTRSVPMADEVAGELDRLAKASSSTADDDLVFADPRSGGPLERAAVLRRYRHALKGAKLDQSHRFHDLRHTFGTRMAAAGVPMRTLQEFMGHRDQATTLRYSDYAPSPHEAEMVAAAFGRSGGDPRGTSEGTGARPAERRDPDRGVDRDPTPDLASKSGVVAARGARG